MTDTPKAGGGDENPTDYASILDALMWIMPFAKGYVSDHRVGNNVETLSAADAVLQAALLAPSPAPLATGGEVGRLREALLDVTANLVAAHSLLKAGGKRAAPSDKMFEQMLKDYEGSANRGRIAINTFIGGCFISPTRVGDGKLLEKVQRAIGFQEGVARGAGGSVAIVLDLLREIAAALRVSDEGVGESLLRKRVVDFAAIVRRNIKETGAPDRVKLPSGDWLTGEGAETVVKMMEKIAETLETIAAAPPPPAAGGRGDERVRVNPEDPAQVETLAKALCSYGDDPPEWGEGTDESWMHSWRDMAEEGLRAIAAPAAARTQEGGDDA